MTQQHAQIAVALRGGGQEGAAAAAAHDERRPPSPPTSSSATVLDGGALLAASDRRGGVPAECWPPSSGLHSARNGGNAPEGSHARASVLGASGSAPSARHATTTIAGHVRRILRRDRPALTAAEVAEARAAARRAAAERHRALLDRGPRC